MPAPERQTALITGASSGIGYELALLLARDGFDLILISRDAAQLAEIAHDLEKAHGIHVRVIAKDLSEPTAARAVFDELTGAGVVVDILVNNAGFGAYGEFARIDLQKQLSMVRLHVDTLTELTGLFLPPMLSRRRGRILNVASTAGFQAGPLMAIYYATKAFQISFSEALASETAGTGVTVSVFCPGPTATNFQKRAGTERSPLFSAVMMDAARVARIAYRGMMAGKPFIVPGFLNNLHLQAVRILPRRLIPRLVIAVQKQREAN